MMSDVYLKNHGESILKDKKSGRGWKSYYGEVYFNIFDSMSEEKATTSRGYMR